MLSAPVVVGSGGCRGAGGAGGARSNTTGSPISAATRRSRPSKRTVKATGATSTLPSARAAESRGWLGSGMAATPTTCGRPAASAGAASAGAALRSTRPTRSAVSTTESSARRTTRATPSAPIPTRWVRCSSTTAASRVSCAGATVPSPAPSGVDSAGAPSSAAGWSKRSTTVTRASRVSGQTSTRMNSRMPRMLAMIARPPAVTAQPAARSAISRRRDVRCRWSFERSEPPRGISPPPWPSPRPEREASPGSGSWWEPERGGGSGWGGGVAMRDGGSRCGETAHPEGWGAASRPVSALEVTGR